MFTWLKKLFSRPAPKPNPYRMVKRVRVLDNEINRANEHWRHHIGHEGVLLGARVDEEGEIWDVKLDSQPIPHSMIMKERFELLPSVAEADHYRNDPAV